MFDLGSGSHPAVFDYNQDGKPDLLIGSDLNKGANNEFYGNLVLLLNTSNTNEISFSVADENFLDLRSLGTNSYTYQPAFGDLDLDGYPDLLIGTQTGFIRHYESTTKAPEPYDFQLISATYADLKVGSRAAPAIVDQDGDGDMDLIVGDNNGQFTLFVNTGTATGPLFTPGPAAPNVYPYGKVSVRETGEIVGSSNVQLVHIADKLEILSGNSKGNIQFAGPVLADRDNQFTLRQLSLPAGHFDGRNSHPLLADLDGDDKYELIIGNIRGGINIYRSDIHTNGSVSLYEPLEPDELILHPNPAVAGQLIHFGTDQTYDQLTLFDLQGNVLCTAQQASALQIPGTIAAGIYFVRIQHTHSQSIRKIVIVD